jgi:hypothetical protein
MECIDAIEAAAAIPHVRMMAEITLQQRTPKSWELSKAMCLAYAQSHCGHSEVLGGGHAPSPVCGHERQVLRPRSWKNPALRQVHVAAAASACAVGNRAISRHGNGVVGTTKYSKLPHY